MPNKMYNVVLTEPVTGQYDGTSVISALRKFNKSNPRDIAREVGNEVLLRNNSCTQATLMQDSLIEFTTFLPNVSKAEVSLACVDKAALRAAKRRSGAWNNDYISDTRLGTTARWGIFDRFRPTPGLN
jgi:hypothetical protein